MVLAHSDVCVLISDSPLAGLKSSLSATHNLNYDDNLSVSPTQTLLLTVALCR